MRLATALPPPIFRESGPFSVGRLIAGLGSDVFGVGCRVGAPAIEWFDGGPRSVALDAAPIPATAVRRGVRFNGARFDRPALVLPAVAFEIYDLAHAVSSLLPRNGCTVCPITTVLLA